MHVHDTDMQDADVALLLTSTLYSLLCLHVTSDKSRRLGLRMLRSIFPPEEDTLRGLYWQGYKLSQCP